MPPSNKTRQVLDQFSRLMAENMTQVPPEEWLRLSATLALATIDMIEASAERKQDIADKYCVVFREGLASRMEFHEFMEKLNPSTLN